MPGCRNQANGLASRASGALLHLGSNPSPGASISPKPSGIYKLSLTIRRYGFIQQRKNNKKSIGRYKKNRFENL